jgi:hypothetical protein
VGPTGLEPVASSASGNASHPVVPGQIDGTSTTARLLTLQGYA